MKATTKKDNNNNNDSSCEDNYSEDNHSRVNENKDNYNCQPLIWPMTMYTLYTNHNISRQAFGCDCCLKEPQPCPLSMSSAVPWKGRNIDLPI